MAVTFNNPQAQGQNSNPAQLQAMLPANNCNGGSKPNSVKSQFNLVAVVSGAATVYLPSFDQISELVSGRPTASEGENASSTNNIFMQCQEISQFGFSPTTDTLDGTATGELTYVNATDNILGQVVLTSAAAFMRRLAQVPYLINKVQMTTAESTSIITTLYGAYGNLGGNTNFTRQLNPESMISGSNTVYANYERWYLTGGTQLKAVAPGAGTFKWTFFTGGFADNYRDISGLDSL